MDTLVVPPLSDDSFALSIASTHRHQWVVSRGHHEQCHQTDPDASLRAVGGLAG